MRISMIIYLKNAKDDTKAYYIHRNSYATHTLSRNWAWPDMDRTGNDNLIVSRNFVLINLARTLPNSLRARYSLSLSSLELHVRVIYS